MPVNFAQILNPKPPQLVAKTCPHKNCGQVFNLPIIQQGILFCPHCEQSLLLSPITTNQTPTPHNANPFLININFNWKFLTSPKSWLWVSIACGILVALRYFKGVDGFKDLQFVFLGVIFFAVVFLILKSIFDSSKQSNLAQLAMLPQQTLWAGMDTLSSVKRYSFNYVSAVNRLHCVAVKQLDKPKEDFSAINGCPHCQSQQLYNVKDALDSNMNFYHIHQIRRPAVIPEQMFDPKTHKYITDNPNIQNLVMCLNCQSHFEYEVLSVKKSLKMRLQSALITVFQLILIVAIVFIISFAQEANHFLQEMIVGLIRQWQVTGELTFTILGMLVYYFGLMVSILMVFVFIWTTVTKSVQAEWKLNNVMLRPI